jgi:hypothetical protein
MMIADSANRVASHTSDQVNQRVHSDTQRRLRYFAEHTDQIDARLRELDQEWDVERVLETGSSTLTLTGLALGLGVNRKWLLLSLAVQGFFLQHALQGWCPPLPVFRQMGFRTQNEIEQERYALKALRGDFANASAAPDAAMAATTP